MTWEQRLRDLVLAGGALTTTACGSSSSGSSFNRTDASVSADATADAAGDASDAIDSAAFSQCCNANPDPCCSYDYCEASITPRCSAEMACQEAGRWDATAFQCVPAVDAGPGDAAPVDAQADAGTEADGSD